MIRHAFDKQVVDLSIAGDVEDVEMEFGLRTRRSTPRPVYHPFFGNPLSDPAEVVSGAITGKNVEASAGYRKVRVFRGNDGFSQHFRQVQSAA